MGLGHSPKKSPEKLKDKHLSASSPDLTEGGTPSAGGRAVECTSSIKKRKVPDSDTSHLDRQFAAWRAELNQNIATTISSSVTSILTEKLDHFNSTLTQLQSNVQKLTASNASIISSLSGMDKRLTDFEASTSFSSDRQDTFDTRLGSVEKLVKTIKSQETEISELKSDLSKVQSNLNKKLQWDRLQNIEITNVPESKNEVLSDIITNIAKHVGITMAATDLEFSTRVQPMKTTPGVPRAIITKVRNRVLKDSIIHGVRKNKGLTTQDIGLPGETKDIFVNEHLTIENRTLHKKVRQLATEKMYTFVWVKNCRIFVRKGDKTPIIHVASEDDLKKIV